MKEPARKQRNDARLAELYPTFRKRVKKVIKWLEDNDERPRIQDAWRSPADQLEAYNSGHSNLKFGFHNVTANDGTPEALAVDMLDDDYPLKPSKTYLLKLAFAAEKAGLVTGIRWGVPAGLVEGIDDAIKSQDWAAKVKVGWDPTHLQPVDITPTQARGGDRPA